MPSTFTTNTGIEKIADGEQSGLWGQTTNLNFDIVDRSLNGAGTVTLSGTTHTLTTSDGVLSDGQFAVLVFTGSLSAPNTVTIDPNTAQKLYWVTNTTSQDVVLTQGSGGDVTIPAGVTKAVYSDGAGAGAEVVDLMAVFVGNVTGDLTGNVTGDLTGNVTGNVTGDVTGDLTGDVTGNVTGALTGNADTATALQTARTIGGVSFNGTANIDLPGVNQAGNQNTSGNADTATTAANLSRSVIAGTGLAGGGELTANRTIDVDVATTAQIQGFSGTAKVPTTEGFATAAALTSPSGASDLTPDWSAFISANWVLTGNRTLQNPTNVIPGTTRVIRVASDGATERTVSFGSNFVGDLNGGPVTDDEPLLYMLYARTASEIWVSALEDSS